MAESIIKLTLDTFRENRIQEPVVMQHDYNSRFIDATFTTLGVFEPISAAAEVMINAKRADGQGKSFSGEVNADGTVRVPIAQWMCALDDRVTCTISAVSATPEQRLSTMPFTILVKASPNTTELPEEGTAEADVLAEVLAGEKERVLAEGIRSLNENARERAEEARQRAEEQRLTDEATRVANEAERVSSELSRDATFKGWVEDIASLPSFDSRISANSDRITNIEAGLPSSVWHVDDTAARVKDVPENARPKAIVNKIGGMTYKSKNLFIPSKVNTTSLGITFSYFNGYVKMSGTKTLGLNIIKVQTPNITLPAGTYTVSCKMVSGSITAAEGFDGVYFGINKDTYSLRTVPGVSVIGAVGKRVITLTEPTDIISFDITPGYKGEGTVFNDTLFEFQFEDGDTATTYQDGYEGLRDAKVTAVKSVGVNLINPTNLANVTDATTNSCDFSTKKSWYVDIFTGTTGFGASVSDVNKILYLTPGEYVISYERDSSYKYYTLRLFFISDEGMSLGDPTIQSEYTPISLPPNSVFTITKATYATLRINTNNGFVFSKLQLERGTVASTFSPYISETIPIPAAVRPANGINAEVYDSIELNENGSVTKRVKCGEVDLGTLDWGEYNDSVFWAVMNDGAYTSSTSSAAFLCAEYYKIGDAVNNDKTMSFGTNFLGEGRSSVVIHDNTYPDAATFKAAMQGVMLIYELAEPIVTDISDLITADNLIGVEGGGTMTFENEYGYDMPNTVTYMLKEVTA